MNHSLNHNIRNLIQVKDYEGLSKTLLANSHLANEGIWLDETGNSPQAHPLHRICDGVFTGALTEDEGVKIATVFLEGGADVNGTNLAENQDSPLTAAISLYADKIALLYIEKGADIHHKGCHGGTALHWAAWCGSAEMVQKLISLGANINQLCVNFKSTPLFWAVHGLKFGDENRPRQQAECVKILVENGADRTIPNIDGDLPVALLSESEEELIALLR